jgi:hypothetical protein
MQTILYLCGAGYFTEPQSRYPSSQIKEAAAVLPPGAALAFNLDEQLLSLIQEKRVLGQHALTRNEAHIWLAVFDHHPALTPDPTLVLALRCPHLHHYHQTLFAKEKRRLSPDEISREDRWTIERAVARLRKKLRGTFQIDLVRIKSAAGYLLVPWRMAQSADCQDEAGRLTPGGSTKLLA